MTGRLSFREKTSLILLKSMPVLLFLLVLVVFSILSPRFIQYRSLENIVKQSSYIGIIAIGITFVLLTAGIDLSVGSNMYLSATVAGLLIRHYDIPVWLALVACLLTGALFGIVNSIFIAKLKVAPFIVTLSTMVAGRGVALYLTESKAVSFPESVIQVGSARFMGIPLPICIFVWVVFVAHAFLTRTLYGRQIYAVGNNIEAARKAGINTDRILGISYVVCGILAALGGFISVAQLGIVNAGFGKNVEFGAIAAAVLGGASLFGGIGTVFPGTVLGAVLIQMVSAGLVFTQVNLYLHSLITAAIIFIAVLLDSFRSGLLAKLRRRNIRVDKQRVLETKSHDDK